MLGQQNESGIEQVHNVAMNVVEGICSIVCRPVELILRPRHGTRYFPVPVVFLSTMLVTLHACGFGDGGNSYTLYPRCGTQPTSGDFRHLVIREALLCAFAVHGLRLWRLMVHLDKEFLSEFEGPPLPFFRLLPGSGSFWGMRILWEPIVLFFVAASLERLLVIQPGLALYLKIASFCLAMREYIAWYKAWEFLRGGDQAGRRAAYRARDFTRGQMTMFIPRGGIPMTLSINQRKCLWLVVIAAAIYFAPSIATRATQPHAAQNVPPVKPSPFAPAPVPFRDLLGQYSGRAPLPRGLCMFQFEIRDNREKSGTFSGYSSLTCAPLYPFRQPSPWPYTVPKPTAAILSGVAEDGAIRFNVDDAVSGPCPPKAMTAKRFGSMGLALQWEDKCGGGKMLLSRSGR